MSLYGDDWMADKTRFYLSVTLTFKMLRPNGDNLAQSSLAGVSSASPRAVERQARVAVGNPRLKIHRPRKAGAALTYTENRFDVLIINYGPRGGNRQNGRTWRAGPVHGVGRWRRCDQTLAEAEGYCFGFNCEASDDPTGELCASLCRWPLVADLDVILFDAVLQHGRNCPQTPLEGVSRRAADRFAERFNEAMEENGKTCRAVVVRCEVPASVLMSTE